MGSMERKQIKVSEILNDLENGLTRYIKDDFGNGSIEAKYDLRFTEVTELFRHPELRNRKTRRVGNGLSFDIINDVSELTLDIKGEEDSSAAYDPEEEIKEYTDI